MADINFGDNKYVIGFTEIQYLPQNESISPTPSDHTIGYTSLALDYAERSNRGELSKFLGHSDNLDKQKRDSVNKIHKSILDLMFEQTERRKTATPIMSKSAMEFQRPDSVFSHTSDLSVKTSSSFPLIEVQQLPPLAQNGFQRMTSCKDMQFDLPEIHGLNWNDRMRINNKSQRSEKNSNPDPNTEEEFLVNNEQINNKSKKSDKDTETIKLTGQTATMPEKKRSKNVKTPNFARKIFTMNEAESSKSVKTNKKSSRGNKSVTLNTDQTQSIEINSKTLFPSSLDILVKPSDAKLLRNKSRISSKRKSSFCQSSYDERAERERMNNIRRRHASQTKHGPLDFNKLRHQLIVTRSNTMFN